MGIEPASIDYETDSWVEADSFDWDEALKFHEELEKTRKERLGKNNN